MDQQLRQLAQHVSRADNLEGLTRPLLELIQRVTGLEAAYLTRIDQQAGKQQILYAVNRGEMNLTEGLSVPWDDTLCKRAIEEGRFITSDVQSRWSDSLTAQSLGIETYISVPIYRNDNQPYGYLYGTLCGASSESLTLRDDLQDLLMLFSELIAHQLDREDRALDKAHQARDAAARVKRMELVTWVSRSCLAAHSLNETLTGVAQQLANAGYWDQAIPMLLEDTETLCPIGQASHQALTLARELIEASPVNLADMTDHEREHLIRAPDDAHWFRKQPLTRELGDRADAALLIVATDEAVEGAIFILSRERFRDNDDDRQLLNNVANALSLLAVRLRDHKRLEEANQELKMHALHDALTGLANRRYLVEELGRMLSLAERRDARLHVVFIDLDRFKQINDTYGHDIGDEFLRQFAQRLQGLARHEDLVSRFGGDEFGLVAPGGDGDPSEERQAIIRRIRDATEGRYGLDTLEIDYAGPSVGVITWQPGDARDADYVLARADHAMYEDKKARRARGL